MSLGWLGRVVEFWVAPRSVLLLPGFVNDYKLVDECKLAASGKGGKGRKQNRVAKLGQAFNLRQSKWNVEWKCKWKCGSWFGKSMERYSKMRQEIACEIAWKDLLVTNPI